MKKLLVANRSEIAIRIFRSATELGMRTIAIYAHEDRLAVHRFKADEAYQVGKGKGPVAAYLDIGDIIRLAKAKNVDLIHPGYGFLSENARFARACAEAGITFVGPNADLLEMMGDKTAARRLAEKTGIPTLPGTDHPIADFNTALKTARRIGFPLIIKAAFGGGGRGMRVVPAEKELKNLLEEARGEAERAFGDPSVFLERYIPRAKHIEVQVIGDRHGNLLHLHERDCSVQRRHQKVIEVAPSINLPENTRSELCQAAVALAGEIGYDNAGTVEFLLDADTNEWFFIEMNPRIQVEHTVTEVITGLDIVAAQIQIAMGKKLHGPEIRFPRQEDVSRNGFAVQCRITTEDPEKKFTPDYGKILSYRSASGVGVRLDGAMGTTGSVITPFYDSMLVKLTTFAPDFATALRRMDRALREFRIRGVKTNIPFLENMVNDPVFAAGNATTSLIDTTPSLFAFKPRLDRATKLLAYLGDVTVNGNPQVKGWKPKTPFPPIEPPQVDLSEKPAPGTRDYLLRHGPEKFARWTAGQKRLLVTDTTFRDANQSLMAARLRTKDMLAVADLIARRFSGLFSLETWGGATFDTSMRFLREDPYERLALLRERIPNICFQMLLRGSNGVGYSFYPDNVIRGFVRHAHQSGIDIFRIFDSLNYLPNMKVAMEAAVKTGAVCEAAFCYTGDLLDPKQEKYTLKYYIGVARELERMGAHILAIKDMAGLCRPFAAIRLIKALKGETGLPIHFHTHDGSGIAAAAVLNACGAGVDVVDLAIGPMSGSTSQPNLNSIVAALRNTPRETGLDLRALNECVAYWEAVRDLYEPFDTSPAFGSAEIYEHQIPGGQYTNMKEQAAAMGLLHLWPDVVRCYEEVNLLFGDIIKVTPSSKVVGDMAMFLTAKGIRPSDVLQLEPGATPFPSSVVDMLSGGLGQPPGGWPRKLQKVVLGDRKPRKGRPGAGVAPVDLEKERANLTRKLGRKAEDADLYEHLMYPEVFQEYVKFRSRFGDVGVLPTSAFYYGLETGEEIAVEIEEGKTLFVKLVHVGTPDKDGQRVLQFELNGRPRQSMVTDRSVHATVKPRVKADPANPRQVGAPIPGMVTTLSVGVGAKVAKGDKLLTLEAMKMQTTLYAPLDGIVEEVAVGLGDSVESKDLLFRLR